MPQVLSNGASVYYEVEGDGPQLLMIAGIASDHASWAPLTPRLRDRYRLILVDNRGCGRTQYGGVLNVGDMVDDCLRLLDHLHIGKTHIVGHSLGAMIGQRIAAMHPGRVDRLVTLAAGAGVSEQQRALFKDLARLYARIEPQLFFRLLYQWLFSDPAFFSESAIMAAAEASTAYPFRQSPRDFARQVDAIDRLRPVPLEAIRSPVLAIAAERDLLMPPEAVAAAHERIGILQMATIPGAGHSVHWEAPDAVAEAIVGFLGE